MDVNGEDQFTALLKQRREELRIGLPSSINHAIQTNFSASTEYKALGCILALAAVALPIYIIYVVVSGIPVHATYSSETYRSTHSSWIYLRYVLTALLIVGLIYALRQKNVRDHWRFFGHIRPVIVLQNLGILTVTVVVAAILKKACPFLDRSLLYRLPILGGHSINLIVLPLYIRFLAIGYAILLTLTLPWMAYDEEMQFRNGTRDWFHACILSLRFGLAHYIMGIPLYIAVALSINGLWLTRQYFKGGVDRSTTYHLTYNLNILSLLLLYMVFHRFVL